MISNSKLNKYGDYLFAVNVDDTYIQIGLFSKNGELIENFKKNTIKARQGEEILPFIAHSIKSQMFLKNIRHCDLIGIGIGVPGPVNELGVIFNAPNINWKTYNIAERLSCLLNNLPVIAENDSNCSLLGEKWIGNAQRIDNCVDIKITEEGVGAGIFLDNHLIKGRNGACGEIGHIQINDKEEEKCNCGKKGCLEQYISLKGLKKIAKEYNFNENTNFKEIIEEIKKGNENAIKIMEKYSDIFGKALSILGNHYNPSHFVLNLSINNEDGEILCQYIKKYYEKYVFNACNDCNIILGKLSDNSGMYGAADLILSKLD